MKNSMFAISPEFNCSISQICFFQIKKYVFLFSMQEGYRAILETCFVGIVHSTPHFLFFLLSCLPFLAGETLH